MPDRTLPETPTVVGALNIPPDVRTLNGAGEMLNVAAAEPQSSESEKPSIGGDAGAHAIANSVTASPESFRIDKESPQARGRILSGSMRNVCGIHDNDIRHSDRYSTAT